MIAKKSPVPIGGLRVSFIKVGDCELEFLANVDLSPPAHVGFAHPRALGGVLVHLVLRDG